MQKSREVSGPKSGPELQGDGGSLVVTMRAILDRSSSGGALSVEGEDLLGYLLYVGNADEGDLYLGGGVVYARCAGGQDGDVSGAVGTLAMLDANYVGRRVSFYGTAVA